MEVGAPDLRAHRRELGEGLGSWMIVAVVLADAHERDARTRRREEALGVRRRAVVGHVEDVDGEVGGAGEQALLGAHLGVAGEQRRPVRPVEAQDERELVEVAGGQPPPRRAEDGDVGVAEGEALPGVETLDDDTRLARRPEHRLGDDALGRVGVDREQERADLTLAQDAGQPAAVVEVAVGQGDDVEAVDPGLAQPAVQHRLVLTAVDEHPGDRRPALGGRLDEEGVALADVERGDREVLDGPSGHEERAEGKRGRRQHRGDGDEATAPCEHRKEEQPGDGAREVRGP